MDCLQEAADAPLINPAPGAAVRRMRKAKGIKQRELAYPIGVSLSQISAYERGKAVIPSAHLCAIAETMGADPEVFGATALLTRTDEEHALLAAFRRIPALEDRQSALQMVNALRAMREHAPC